MDAIASLKAARGLRDRYVKDLQRLKRTRDGIDTAIRSKKAQLEAMNDLIRQLQPTAE